MSLVRPFAHATTRRTPWLRATKAGLADTRDNNHAAKRSPGRATEPAFLRSRHRSPAISAPRPPCAPFRGLQQQRRTFISGAITERARSDACAAKPFFPFIVGDQQRILLQIESRATP